MFKTVLKKIKRNSIDYGLGVCVSKICSHILKPFFEVRTYHIYVIDLQKSPARGPRQPSHFTFRFIGPDENKLIAQIEDMEERFHGKLAERLRSGQKCLVALQDETVAGFNLVGFDTFQLPLIRLSKPMRRYECFSEQISVHQLFRNKGLGADLRHEIFAAMKGAGYHRMYGGTQVFNSANRALSKKVGLKEFAVARFTNIFWFKRLSIRRKKD
jgi:GNAT superfamily N-acetyltransferase